VRVHNTCHDVLGDPSLSGDEAKTPARSIRIAFLGYLDAARGADMLLDAVERPGSGIEMIAAGTCRSPALLERLKTTSAIDWRGSVPYHDALEIMRNVDLVALLLDPGVTSYRLLTGPTKFFESMMAGTPVVVSAETRLADLVLDRGLGFVVPYGDPAALESVATELRRDGVREAYRMRCRQHYLAECQLVDEVGRYRDFYHQVLGRAA
jgi:glycosyltransferase involved in cell wall biosynthesis